MDTGENDVIDALEVHLFYWVLISDIFGQLLVYRDVNIF